MVAPEGVRELPVVAIARPAGQQVGRQRRQAEFADGVMGGPGGDEKTERDRPNVRHPIRQKGHSVGKLMRVDFLRH